jgi:hypothetical protein
VEGRVTNQDGTHKETKQQLVGWSRHFSYFAEYEENIWTFQGGNYDILETCIVCSVKYQKLADKPFEEGGDETLALDRKS